MVGGILYLTVGFERTMDINMIAEFILAIVFYVFNCGTDVVQKEKNLKETVDKLKEIGERRKKRLENDESEMADTVIFDNIDVS